MTSDLLVSRGASISDAMPLATFRKADAPRTGDHYGPWNVDPRFYRLPGGSIVQFDLDQLTLEDFRMMRSDPQLNASLLLLTAMLAQADWSIYTKGQETDPKARKISEEIEEGMRRYWLPLVRAVSQAYWAGYAPTALVYDLNPVTLLYEIINFKDLIPEICAVDWKVQREPDGSEIRSYSGINVSAKKIPGKQTFWYPVLMEAGDYYGRKLMKPAFAPWYFSMLLHLYTNRYFERFGEPTAIGYYPPDENITVTDPSTSQPVVKNSRDVMVEVLTSLRSRGVVTMPSSRDPDSHDLDWEIKFLESQMRGVDFDRYLARLDNEKAMALFTPALYFESTGGGSDSRATAPLKDKMFHWLLNLLVNDLKQYLDLYVVKPLHDINYSPRAPVSQFRFRTLGRLTDDGARSVLQALIQNGGAKLSQTGIKDLGDYMGVDLEYLSGTITPEGQPHPTTQPGSGADGAGQRGPGTPGTPPQRTATSSNARHFLVSARQRLEEQVDGIFARHQRGHDLERALAKPRLGFKQAFMNEMSAAGVASDSAENFFHQFEREVLDGVRSAKSSSDAKTSIADTYSDYGLDGAP